MNFLRLFCVKKKDKNVNVYISWMDFTNVFSSSIISYSVFHLIYVKTDDAFVKIVAFCGGPFSRDACITYIG